MSALSRPRKRTALGGLALLLALTGSAFAVGNTFGSTPAAADELLPAFDDCDALTARMRDLAAPYVGRYGFGGDDRAMTDMVPTMPQSMPEPMEAPAATAADAAGSALSSKSAPESSQSSRVSGSSANDAVGPGATGTNLQEAGVDEPDVAKTDGRLVVSIDGGRLRIVDVSTDRPEARGTLDLAAAGINPTELLLDGDRVLVIGTSSGYQGRDDDSFGGSSFAAPESDTRIARPYGGRAALALVDIGDPGSPRLLATEEITGRHVSARLSDGVARIVVTSTPDLRFRSGYGPGDNSAENSAQTYNSDVLRLAKAEDWLPSRTITDGSGRIVSPAAPLVDCADVRYPAQDSGMDLLSVVTMDLGRDDALSAASSTAVVTAGELVYASQDRLYVATTQGGWGSPVGMGRSAPARDDVRTAVHEFDVSRPAGTGYLSSGSVQGYIPGRWALSEFDGDLRVVTTTQEPWNSDAFSSGQTESHVVVLTPRRGHLAEIGRVGGLGHGETVRAVRWFDELAAVVTFRQTDPLYLVDLGVPDRPVLRGALKVPGYSAYLHPIGDHRLLGVGQDATETGQETSLQISSFDIADAADPRRVDTVGYGQGSSSPVQDDARGFVYLPERRTAVLPAVLPQTDRGCNSFGGECGYATGLVSVRVGEDGRLAKAGSWQSLDDPGWRERPVHKVLSLPGGRLAALDSVGVTVLDADNLAPRGSVAYTGGPSKRF